MEVEAGPTRQRLAAAAVAVGGVIAGFVLAVLVGWPPFGEARGDPGAVGLMCSTLDDVDASYLQRMTEDDLGLGSPGDRRNAASLLAAVGYAEAAAASEEADGALLDTGRDLRTALERIQPEVAHEHVEDLRGHC